MVLSKSLDNGEILEQVTDNTAPKILEEYVLQSSLSNYEEYVIEGDTAVPVAGSMEAAIEMPSYQPSDIPQEYNTDILDPLKQPGYTPDAQQPETAKTYSFSVDAEDMPDIPMAEEIPEIPKPQLSEEDLFADMQSILSGEKVFDPVTKRTVSKDKLSQQSSASSSSAPPPRQQQQEDGLPQLPKSNEHAIFDRIAQSMQYANAYDLGSIDLDNRFSDFDRIADYKEKETAEKKNPADVQKEKETAPKAGHAEFIQDLDAIKKQQQEKAPATSPKDMQEATPAVEKNRVTETV
jgi:hypothetical protein